MDDGLNHTNNNWLFEIPTERKTGWASFWEHMGQLYIAQGMLSTPHTVIKYWPLVWWEKPSVSGCSLKGIRDIQPISPQELSGTTK